MNFTGIHFPETWLPESSMHIGSAITYSNQENKERAVWNKEQKYINFGTTLILANATGGYYSGATILYFNL